MPAKPKPARVEPTPPAATQAQAIAEPTAEACAATATALFALLNSGVHLTRDERNHINAAASDFARTAARILGTDLP